MSARSSNSGGVSMIELVMPEMLPWHGLSSGEPRAGSVKSST
jgi:hypothetical protein